MVRYCPNCKTKLGDYDHFFCTSCGHTLDDSLVKRDDAFKRVADFATEGDKRSSEKFKFFPARHLKSLHNGKAIKPVHIIGGLILLLFILSGAYVLKNDLFTVFSKKQLDVQLPSKLLQNTTANIINTKLSWHYDEFGKDKLLEYVPFDSSIVIEGNDLQKLGEAYSLLDPAYKDLAEFISANANPHFVLFATEITENDQPTLVWSLITLPTEQTLSIPQELLTSYPWIKVWKNEPIMLLTSDARVIDQVTESKAMRAKNFTQTTVYATNKPSLSQQAQMLVYFTAPNAKNSLNVILGSDNLPNDVRLVIEEVTKSKSDFLILR